MERSRLLKHMIWLISFLKRRMIISRDDCPEEERIPNYLIRTLDFSPYVGIINNTSIAYTLWDENYYAKVG